MMNMLWYAIIPYKKYINPKLNPEIPKGFKFETLNSDKYMIEAGYYMIINI